MERGEHAKWIVEREEHGEWIGENSAQAWIKFFGILQSRLLNPKLEVQLDNGFFASRSIFLGPQ